MPCFKPCCSKQLNPLWLRDVQISPDGTGKRYKGDIYKVPSNGGTSLHKPHTSPIWSPDSKQIAFASDRNGNFDLFVMSADGGAARRLNPFGFRNTVNLHHRRQLYPVLGLYPRPCQQCLVPYLGHDRTIQSPGNCQQVQQMVCFDKSEKHTKTAKVLKTNGANTTPRPSPVTYGYMIRKTASIPT